MFKTQKHTITKLTTAETPFEKEVQSVVNREAKGNVHAYIKNLKKHGCPYSIVDKVVDIADKHNIYEKHKDEIWNIIKSPPPKHYDLFSFVQSFNDKTNFVNILATWFAFEIIAIRLYNRELKKQNRCYFSINRR